VKSESCELWCGQSLNLYCGGFLSLDLSRISVQCSDHSDGFGIRISIRVGVILPSKLCYCAYFDAVFISGFGISGISSSLRLRPDIKIWWNKNDIFTS
jgi:hypothetical protein